MSKITTIRIGPELEKKLEDYGKINDLNFSEAIRKILQGFFDEKNASLLRKIISLTATVKTFNTEFQNDMIKTKKALFHIGTSNPVTIKRTKELFRDEDLS